MATGIQSGVLPLSLGQSVHDGGVSILDGIPYTQQSSDYMSAKKKSKHYCLLNGVHLCLPLRPPIRLSLSNRL